MSSPSPISSPDQSARLRAAFDDFAPLAAHFPSHRTLAFVSLLAFVLDHPSPVLALLDTSPTPPAARSFSVTVATSSRSSLIPHACVLLPSHDYLAGEVPIINALLAVARRESALDLPGLLSTFSGASVSSIICMYLLDIPSFRTPSFLFPALSIDGTDSTLASALFLASLPPPLDNYDLKPHLRHIATAVRAALHRADVPALTACVILLDALYTPAHTPALNEFFTSSRIVRLTLRMFDMSVAMRDVALFSALVDLKVQKHRHDCIRLYLSKSSKSKAQVLADKRRVVCAITSALAIFNLETESLVNTLNTLCSLCAGDDNAKIAMLARGGLRTVLSFAVPSADASVAAYAARLLNIVVEGATMTIEDAMSIKTSASSSDIPVQKSEFSAAVIDLLNAFRDDQAIVENAALLLVKLLAAPPAPTPDTARRLASALRSIGERHRGSPGTELVINQLLMVLASAERPTQENDDEIAALRNAPELSARSRSRKRENSQLIRSRAAQSRSPINFPRLNGYFNRQRTSRLRHQILQSKQVEGTGGTKLGNDAMSECSVSYQQV